MHNNTYTYNKILYQNLIFITKLIHYHKKKKTPSCDEVILSFQPESFISRTTWKKKIFLNFSVNINNYIFTKISISIIIINAITDYLLALFLIAACTAVQYKRKFNQFLATSKYIILMSYYQFI